MGIFLAFAGVAALVAFNVWHEHRMEKRRRKWRGDDKDQ